MILFTLDEHGKNILKEVFVYLLAALFCALFGAVYERFSHEVYSYYMIYAFAIPLGAGAVPLLAILLSGRKYPGNFALNAWNSGVAALTVGCLFRGVLEIYGTTNRLTMVYPVAAAVLMGTGIIFYGVGGKGKRISK